MTTACRELLLLSMTVSMGMLIFAGLGYALEKDEEDTMFYTLPQVRSRVSRVTGHVSRVQTLYWAIITMTSTGYGDISPKTSAGKLVASLCAICGVLCITLPIPIIVANFNRSARLYNRVLMLPSVVNNKDSNLKRGLQSYLESCNFSLIRLIYSDTEL